MPESQIASGLRALVTDPTFYGKPREEQIAALSGFVPEVTELAPDKLNKLFGKLSSRFRVVGAEQTGLPGVPRFTGDQPRPKTPGVDFSEGAAPLFLTQEQRERGETSFLDQPEVEGRERFDVPLPHGRTLSGVAEETAGAFTSAMFSLVTGAGNVATAMGLENIGEGLATVGKTGEGLMFRPDPDDGKDFIDDPSKLTDPRYLARIFGGAAGSMVGFAGAGGAAARGSARVAQALKLSERGSRIAATVGGTAAASTFEALIQAGQSYGEAIESGASPETAGELAAKVATNTIGPTLALNAAGLYNDTIKSGVRKAFASVAGEIAQESSQQVGTNLAFSETGVDPGRGAFEGVPESALGGLAGGTVGGAIVGGGRPTDRGIPEISSVSAPAQQESAPVTATAGTEAGVSAESAPAEVATPDEITAGTPAPEPKHGIDASLFDEAKNFIEQSSRVTKKDIRERFGLTRDEGETLVNAMVDGGVLSRDEGGRIARPEQAQPAAETPAAEKPPEPKTVQPLAEKKEKVNGFEAAAEDSTPATPTSEAKGEETRGEIARTGEEKARKREDIRERDLEAAENAALRAEADAAHAAAETTPEAEQNKLKQAAAKNKAKAVIEQAGRTLKLFAKQRGKAEPAFARVEELRDKLKADPSSADPRELADMTVIAAKQAAGKKITADMVDSPGAKEFLRGEQVQGTSAQVPEKSNTADFEAAREKHNRAAAKFDKVREDFREKRIGDEEFLAAKAEMDAATAEFDRAFEKAAGTEGLAEKRRKQFDREAAAAKRKAKLTAKKSTAAKVDAAARVAATEPPAGRVEPLAKWTGTEAEAHAAREDWIKQNLVNPDNWRDRKPDRTIGKTDLYETKDGRFVSFMGGRPDVRGERLTAFEMPKDSRPAARVVPTTAKVDATAKGKAEPIEQTRGVIRDPASFLGAVSSADEFRSRASKIPGFKVLSERQITFSEHVGGGKGTQFEVELPNGTLGFFTEFKVTEKARDRHGALGGFNFVKTGRTPISEQRHQEAIRITATGSPLSNLEAGVGIHQGASKENRDTARRLSVALLSGDRATIEEIHKDITSTDPEVSQRFRGPGRDTLKSASFDAMRSLEAPLLAAPETAPITQPKQPKKVEAVPPPEKAPFKPTVVPPAPDLGGKKLPASVAAQILEAVRPTQESYVDLKEGRKTYTRSPLDDFGKDVSEGGLPFILAGRTEAARKKLVELGLAEGSPAHKVELTPRGREMARHLLAQEQRLKEGVPIAERPKRKGVPNPFKDTDAGHQIGREMKFDGRTFHTDGHFAVEGKSPVENRSGDIPPDMAAKVLTPRGKLTDVKPVAFSADQEAAKLKKTEMVERIHFDRPGLALRADLFDYVTSKVGENVEWKQDGGLDGGVFAFKGDKVVAVIMPVRLPKIVNGAAVLEFGKRKFIEKESEAEQFEPGGVVAARAAAGRSSPVSRILDGEMVELGGGVVATTGTDEGLAAIIAYPHGIKAAEAKLKRIGFKKRHNAGRWPHYAATGDIASVAAKTFERFGPGPEQRTDADGNPVRDKHNSNGSGRGFLDPSLTFPCQ